MQANEPALRIYKYALEASPNLLTVIQTQRVVEVLKVDLQAGKPHIWLLVDAHTPPATLTVTCIPTGGTVDKARERIGNHLGTIVMPSGLVWHFFQYLGESADRRVTVKG